MNLLANLNFIFFQVWSLASFAVLPELQAVWLKKWNSIPWFDLKPDTERRIITHQHKQTVALSYVPLRRLSNLQLEITQPQGEHYFAHPPFFVMLLIPFRSVVCNSQLDSREVQWILIVLNFNEILKNQLQQRATMQRQQQKCINIQNRDYTNQLQPFSHLAVPCIYLRTAVPFLSFFHAVECYIKFFYQPWRSF